MSDLLTFCIIYSIHRSENTNLFVCAWAQDPINTTCTLHSYFEITYRHRDGIVKLHLLHIFSTPLAWCRFSCNYCAVCDEWVEEFLFHTSSDTTQLLFNNHWLTCLPDPFTDTHLTQSNVHQAIHTHTYTHMNIHCVFQGSTKE